MCAFHSVDRAFVAPFHTDVSVTLVTEHVFVPLVKVIAFVGEHAFVFFVPVLA